ncbi:MULTISPECIES: helix-turn-helix domain-containing protein [Flavobacterium]|jgi:transcriptional regulator with XRE-family HTH domain|uniref:Helix-turn-helix domain-containing protein n=1 Tax=Flavobacterium jumunjinense TaxID=998845 RepID=A0ABV5GQA6_9FLAO|nr:MULTISPECIES: helix-turn-helix transcriptional regulator [Flavobacterium]
MNIGDKIKAVREAKNLSQKEISNMVQMDQSQYSKIENGKTDPTTNTLEKIAKALGIELSELFISDKIFKDINSADKTIMEKIRLIEMLDEKEQASIYNIVDGLVASKRLRNSLSNALSL